METGGKCCVCGGDHRASRCPDLCDPLKEGFFQGGGGGGGGCDDHDHDDRLKLELWVAAGETAVLRRRWKSHEDSYRLNPQFSLHAGSYAARHQSAVLCRA
jgi:hypothetical protein